MRISDGDRAQPALPLIAVLQPRFTLDRDFGLMVQSKAIGV
jgi:hypothetical protein